ncbi:hypothetical protein J0X19_10930 [Hymenobacter sp. BT186]|uniref:Uncharacterized protein n=1 Tax=Hymenobacter telluris TaxID=2816474 RepID=A0A939EXL0_9BACT|nr:hypothetical protein [Hymenobacter telluris]MBO0358460.1 hypothetical protein [Hymenobacter telluris]MBW3374486.1 hypothetical protein [Hymenobacter norwichensis]
MSKYLSIIGAALLLGAASCQDKDEAPAAPKLEGSWTHESTTQYSYDAGGRLVSTKGPEPFPIPYRLDITADSIFIVITSPPVYKASAKGYKRQGNNLIYAHNPVSVEIKELTAHTLVLYTKGPPAYGTIIPYQIDEEERFTR